MVGNGRRGGRGAGKHNYHPYPHGNPSSPQGFQDQQQHQAYNNNPAVNQPYTHQIVPPPPPIPGYSTPVSQPYPTPYGYNTTGQPPASPVVFPQQQHQIHAQPMYPAVSASGVPPFTGFPPMPPPPPMMYAMPPPGPPSHYTNPADTMGSMEGGFHPNGPSNNSRGGRGGRGFYSQRGGRNEMNRRGRGGGGQGYHHHQQRGGGRGRHGHAKRNHDGFNNPGVKRFKASDDSQQSRDINPMMYFMNSFLENPWKDLEKYHKPK